MDVDTDAATTTATASCCSGSSSPLMMVGSGSERCRRVGSFGSSSDDRLDLELDLSSPDGESGSGRSGIMNRNRTDSSSDTDGREVVRALLLPQVVYVPPPLPGGATRTEEQYRLLGFKKEEG